MSTPSRTEAVPAAAQELAKQAWWEGLRVLPTLPSVLFRFLGLLGDPEVGPEGLADFIWNDPALLSRALPMTRDLIKRGSEPGDSLRQGIASLGRERIRNLAYTTPLLRSFEPLGVGSYAATFWERSIVCAHACEAAARRLQLPGPERYYVAGLLHDIGYLALLRKQPVLLPSILQRWTNRPAHLLEIEAEVMGVDHCQLGVKVAAQLGLGSWIHPAIADHHCPTQDSDPIPRITCIGGAFCNYQGVDFFPRRTLLPAMREREMQEIIRGLLPALSEEERSDLMEEMQKAVHPIRRDIREALIEWQVAGEIRVMPHSSLPLQQPAVAAMA